MSILKNNNAQLEALIEQVKALPEAGGEDVTAEVTAQTTLIDDLEAAVDALPDAGNSAIETCTVTVKGFQSIHYTDIESGEFVSKSSTGASASANHTVNAVRNSLLVGTHPSAINYRITNADYVCSSTEDDVWVWKIHGESVIIEAASGGGSN